MRTIFIGVTQFSEQHKKYVDVLDPFFKIPKILKIIRILWFRFKLPYFSIWLKSDLNNLIKGYDLVIVAATPFNVRILTEISANTSPQTKLILWYWNPIKKVCQPEDISNKWTQVTFDLLEAEEYKIKYGNTYYFDEFVDLKNTSEKGIIEKSDLFFIGLDKGRSQKLIDLSKTLKPIGINLNLYLVRDRTSKYSTFDYKPKVSYNEIILMINNSKALLDFNQDGQTGLTLRTMEGLFFEKKIVTNNISILNYDFYNSQNIFILGKDSLNDLRGFLDSPYEKIPEIIKNQYLFSNWLKVIENEC